MEREVERMGCKGMERRWKDVEEKQQWWRLEKTVKENVDMR